ncbi:tetratricopeptide repeat protein [Streptomyces niveiscabiei]|uniref:Tetratricopeptide repeat protein n=1 Tax=Streptomyces niveiscabiei TaxID=164115 RepID=A0ABW9I1C5_9ACTN
MRRPKPPNRALRALLAESGWSGARLALEVNSLGTAQGFTLTYDRTAVSHWLSGTRPRPPAPELVAQALSRRLGRRLRATDTGLVDAADPAADLAAGEDGVAPLDGALGQDGVALLDGALGLAARRAVYLPGGTPPLGAPRPAPPDGTRIGAPHVESARHLLVVLSRSDDVFGSGAVREPLRRFLGTTLLPWLRGSAPPGVRRELFEVAAQLAYLCGFVAYDSGRHALAQRMYWAAARLADEVGDRVGHAVALRGLSVLAHQLGHADEARALARGAARIGVRHAPPRQHAFFLGQLAVAEAATGDPACLARLTQTERCLERAGGAGELPTGAFHPGVLALQQAYVHRARGDHRSAVRALETSLRHRPPDERRSTAITLADLALTHLDIGHLDRACAAAHTFLDTYPVIASDRADTRLRTLLARLRPHARNRAAAGVLERARETRRTAP